MYDDKTNTFFEADTNQPAIAEEFFLVDKDSGAPILLTKVINLNKQEATRSK